MTATAQEPSRSSSDGLQGLPPVLQRELRRELRRWRVGTNAYGGTYYGLRIVLIATSAIVAADQNLGQAKGSWLLSWVPALSLIVAITTAIDTWLKPQQKWRGFMESRDALADLLVQAEGGLPAEEVRSRFLKLRQRHRERNIF
ncbi:DUF4231 domain-containing protein [Streptomyces roseochromogenus]|uniref:SMODS and SLOG-associating 2TM effector domain-containing protein n=1 Tax=Streptomyces roseochromogenus subsp. oscitans DS 12.976 TaxID=1352936 RepID=V6KYA1_STRRC|nr:DUF4231 domain-containing protein [Streptomyces roseochromogenus]EST36416.1 hypothetical protein M878_02205 [Streptomyces roseochromogenus subsp. oscitans DS 12.976]